MDWQNWSGSQTHTVKHFASPHSEEALAESIVRASELEQTVRVVGSGHSFVNFWTDDTLLSLDNMKGLIEVDTANQQATVWAGTKLHELGEPLWQAGLAMENMGDIDRQSIAGAVGTGTHGTGANLKNISSQIVAVKMIGADAEQILLDATTPDALAAAKVSMGMLGVMTQIKLQLVPQYYLHEKTWSCSVSECEAKLDELIAENRHFEFFWNPKTDQCDMKAINVTDREDTVVLNENERCGRVYEILPSEREWKFNESEYSVPAETGWQAFQAVRKLMQERYPDVQWPLEYRTLKADDALLSTASARDVVTLSVHQGYKYEYREFFAAVEKLLLGFGGRPHWGKIHTLKANDLAKLYPSFNTFAELRKKFDPYARFLNASLRELFLT